MLEPLASKKLQRKLKPIFETVVERITFPIHSGETDLEVAVDHGFIKADGRREPISEIEIEVKHGDPSGIAMVADRLAQTVPITYAARSKAELTQHDPRQNAAMRSALTKRQNMSVLQRSTSIPRCQLRTHFRQSHCPVLIMQ